MTSVIAQPVATPHALPETPHQKHIADPEHCAKALYELRREPMSVSHSAVCRWCVPLQCTLTGIHCNSKAALWLASEPAELSYVTTSLAAASAAGSGPPRPRAASTSSASAASPSEWSRAADAIRL